MGLSKPAGDSVGAPTLFGAADGGGRCSFSAARREIVRKLMIHNSMFE